MANALDLTLINDAQADGQWQASNDGLTELANAEEDILAVDFSGGNVTLSDANFTRCKTFKPSGLSTNRDLTVPAIKRAQFIVHNSDAADTISVKRGATTIAVAAGQIAVLYTDGTTDGLFGTVLSAGSGGGVTDGDKGDVTVTSAGATWTIDNDVVTNAKAANMAQSTIKGRAVSAGTGDPTDLTATQATAILDALVGDSGSGGTKGLAPAPSSGDAAAGKFLKADATWAVPAGGGGSSKPFLQFHPYANEPPASNYATLDVRNQHPCLDFDATTSESAIFSGVMPNSYAGGNLIVDVTATLTSATAGTLGWLVAFERIGNGSQDIDSDSFASDQTITATTVPGTSGNTIVLSVTVTAGAATDSIAAGELFRIRVARDTANDTATGDAELLSVTVREA